MKFKNIILALFLAVNIVNATEPTPEEVAKNTENLINILNGIKDSINHYEELEKEFKTINLIKLKKSLVLGTSKYLKGYITIKELSSLSSLSNNFDTKNSTELINFIPETINFIFNLILTKATTPTDIKSQEVTASLIYEIKQELSKKFNINIDDKTANPANNLFLNNNAIINAILANPTVQKIIVLIKTNPEVFKNFILYILSYNLSESSIIKQDLEKLLSNCYCLKN